MEKDCIKVKEEKKEINPDSAKMVEATAIPDSVKIIYIYIYIYICRGSLMKIASPSN